MAQPCALAAGAVYLAFAASACSAAELYDGEGLSVRWDNTVRYSTTIRVGARDAALLSDRNADDSDRNFSRGLISNRFDLLSQLDFTMGRVGFDASAAFWYDTVYHQKNDNNSPSTFNPISVPNNQFTRAVRELHGANAELLNAFFHGSIDIAGLPLSFRLGRHVLLWGESLFFTDNGIAAGQAPIDQIKVFTHPIAYARDAALPVAQVSANLQLSEAVSVEGYYQFEWRQARFPGSGSYFSTVDYLDAGGERYLLSGDQYLLRSSDRTPPGTGQFGVAMRWSFGEIDYGLYALRFNAKAPQIYYKMGIYTAPNGAITVLDPSLVDLATGKVGIYDLVYPEGIESFGASASGYVGRTNVAVEISGRRNSPLVSRPSLELPGQIADANRHPLYAVGDTLHAQISAITTLGRTALWDSANINAEIAANDRIAVTKNKSALDYTTDKAAVAFRGSFDATYFEVVPNLAVTRSVGLGFNLGGNASTESYQSRRGGDVEIGLSATYRVVWKADLMYTHYFGSPYHQPLADRDYISFGIQRTF